MGWVMDLVERHSRVNNSLNEYFAREAVGSFDAEPLTEPDRMLKVRWSNRITEYDGDPAFDGYGHFDLQARFLPNAVINQVIDVLRPFMESDNGLL